MATLKAVSEQIMRILGRRTDDSDIDIREIMLACSQASSEIIRIRALQEKNNPEDIVSSADNNTKTYKNLPVLKDEECGDFYFDLPVSVTSLPNGSGIRLVAPMSCPSDSYIPFSNSFQSLYGDLDILCAMGVGYYLDGDKIRFVGMTDSNNPSKVLVRLVSALDEDSEVPADMQAEIIRAVLSIYSNFQPQDESNDQIDLV